MSFSCKMGWIIVPTTILRKVKSENLYKILTTMPGLQATLSRCWLRLCFYHLPSAVHTSPTFIFFSPFWPLSVFIPFLLPAVLLYSSHPFWVDTTTQHPYMSLLSISSSPFSHFLGVCQLMSPDPMSSPSWSLLHFKIHDLALVKLRYWNKSVWL